MADRGTSIRLNVTIREDQKAYLDLHPEYNISGILQAAIDRIMGKAEGSA